MNTTTTSRNTITNRTTNGDGTVTETKVSYVHVGSTWSKATGSTAQYEERTTVTTYAVRSCGVCKVAEPGSVDWGCTCNDHGEVAAEMARHA